jgi:hypothetical protein
MCATPRRTRIAVLTVDRLAVHNAIGLITMPEVCASARSSGRVLRTSSAGAYWRRRQDLHLGRDLKEREHLKGEDTPAS